jgi:hypothetical protein
MVTVANDTNNRLTSQFQNAPNLFIERRPGC